MGLRTRVTKAFSALLGSNSGEKAISSTSSGVLGSLTPGSRTRVNWSEYRADEAIAHAYQKSFYLNTCVDAIVEAAAAVPLKVYKKSPQETWEPDSDNGLQYLLDHPNPNFTRRMLIERVAGHLILAGNGLWYKVRNGEGVIVELWPLNPDLVTPVPGSNGQFIKHYKYGKGKNAKILPPEDVVHFMRTNYQSLYWGAGQIQVGQRLIDFDSASLDWNKVAIQNAGVIPGVLGIKQKITDKQLADLREKMRRKRLGMDEAGEDLIIGSEVSYNRIGSNAQEMDWIESRKLTRQDIAMFMRVPLPMVSIYDDATLANIEQARKIFYLDRIIPFLANLEDALNLAITPEFGDPIETRVEFDYSNIAAIQDNHFEKARTANVLVRIGFHPQAVNRRLAMGYSDDEVVPDFLVTAEDANEITSIGTQAGTRSDYVPAVKRRRATRDVVGRKERNNLHQWHGIVRGKINNELMREKDQVLTLLRENIDIKYVDQFNSKWEALYLAAGKAISDYYIGEFDSAGMKRVSAEHSKIRGHLLDDLLNRNDGANSDAVEKLITWLYNNWTGDQSNEMADAIISVATGEYDD